MRWSNLTMLSQHLFSFPFKLSPISPKETVATAPPSLDLPHAVVHCVSSPPRSVATTSTCCRCCRCSNCPRRDYRRAHSIDDPSAPDRPHRARTQDPSRSEAVVVDHWPRWAEGGDRWALGRSFGRRARGSWRRSGDRISSGWAEMGRQGRVSREPCEFRRFDHRVAEISELITFID